MIREATVLTCMVAAVAGCGGTLDLPDLAVDGGRDDDASAPPSGSREPATPADGGPPDRDATGPRPAIDLASFPELADCLPSAYELHVRTTGGSVFPAGAFGIDGTKGNWSGRVRSQSIMQLDIATGWRFVWVDPDSFLNAGTYVVGERYPQVSVEFDGKGCGGAPGDTFTVVEYASTGSDQASLTRLVAWFDLTCDRVGSVRGCVRYGR
jgi:hypothetical protein